jgi:hypothetical protein
MLSAHGPVHHSQGGLPSWVQVVSPVHIPLGPLTPTPPPPHAAACAVASTLRPNGCGTDQLPLRMILLSWQPSAPATVFRIRPIAMLYCGEQPGWCVSYLYGHPILHLSCVLNARCNTLARLEKLIMLRKRAPKACNAQHLWKTAATPFLSCTLQPPLISAGQEKHTGGARSSSMQQQPLCLRLKVVNILVVTVSKVRQSLRQCTKSHWGIHL